MNKRIKKLGKKISNPMLISLLLGVFITPNANATISQTQVDQYASAMNSSVNSKNIDEISKLIADDAVIKITHNGKSGTLNKSKYIQYLQKQWQASSRYHYTVEISKVVDSGNSIKVMITTKENVTKDSKTTAYLTESTATLSNDNGQIVLKKAISNVTINQVS